VINTLLCAIHSSSSRNNFATQPAVHQPTTRLLDLFGKEKNFALPAGFTWHIHLVSYCAYL